MFNKSLTLIGDVNPQPREHCEFGVSYLDDALDGIYPDDLVVVTARTGAGKTEFSTLVAMHSALRGKRVHMFALEAFRQEIESRMLFRLLSQAFFMQENWRDIGEVPRYQSWLYGKQKHLFSRWDESAKVEMKHQAKNLNTFYTHEGFTIDKFEQQVNMIGRDTDLLIIDHLHHFDLESDDEVREMKRIVRKIRDITQFFQRPTLVVAHLRKGDKRFDSIVPELEDIHGSSEVVKIATKIIALAPDNDREPIGPIYPTYFKILKNRYDGSTTRFTASCGFNIQRNAYEERYALGRIKKDRFEIVPDEKAPAWAKRRVGATNQGSLLSRLKDVPNEARFNPSDR